MSSSKPKKGEESPSKQEPAIIEWNLLPLHTVETVQADTDDVFVLADRLFGPSATITEIDGKARITLPSGKLYLLFKRDTDLL